MPAELVLLASERTAVLDEVPALRRHGHDAARAQQPRKLLHPREARVFGQVREHRIGGNQIERSVGERGRRQRIAPGRTLQYGNDDRHASTSIGSTSTPRRLAAGQSFRKQRRIRPHPHPKSSTRVSAFTGRPSWLGVLLDERHEREGLPQRMFACGADRVPLQQVVGKARHAYAVDDWFRDAAHQQGQPGVVSSAPRTGRTAHRATSGVRRD